MPERIRWLGTTRIAQLTGSSSKEDPVWPHAEDPLHIPLLNDTGLWGVVGVDMGTSVEHSDGRLYIYFGDVAGERRHRAQGYQMRAEPLLSVPRSFAE